MPQAENEFQVGDIVEVIVDYYTYTIRGTIGEIITAGNASLWPWVRVISFPNGINSRMVGDKFQLAPHNLRKVDPNAPRPKTMEEILEILGRKIDSKEAWEACIKEIDIGPLVDTPWWRDRDSARRISKYFKRITLPGACNMVPQDADLHLSKCKTKVAFVENEDKQKRDIWTVMGYGRYLTKYHPELDNEQVKSAVDVFNYDYGPAPEVHFGESEDEFIRAIKDGPSESCMAKLSFKGHIHPAAVYAAGDIKVAWLERDGRVTARTLVNKETKAFSRVYGDEAKLKPQLEALGYESKVGALAGCRLRKIPNQNGDGFIMAYVDAGVGPGGGSLYFEEDGEYFKLTDDDDGRDTYVGYDYGGVTIGHDDDDDDGYHCDRCGDECDEDDLFYIEREARSVCRDCRDRHYASAIVGRSRSGIGYRYENVRQDRCTFVECLDEYVENDFLCELDIEMDYYSHEYIYNDYGVTTVKDAFSHRDDCEECGTDEHGVTLYIHKTEIDKVQAGELFKNSDGDLFWHESREVANWKGDEDHNPDEYVDVYIAPEVKPEAPKAAPVEPVKIKVGDIVKVLNNNGWGPVGHVGRVLKANSNSVVVETPGGGVRIGEGFGWAHMIASVQLVEQTPTKPTWQAAYLRMQERGIKFVCGGLSSSWSFVGIKEGYSIDPTQTPPSDWREIYKEAQDNGVVFDSRNPGSDHWISNSGGWCFDSGFDQYRLKETT